MIETLDDILEDLADRIGVYGGHDDDESVPCRICWVSDLRDHIKAAMTIEAKLSKPAN